MKNRTIVLIFLLLIAGIGTLLLLKRKDTGGPLANESGAKVPLESEQKPKAVKTPFEKGEPPAQPLSVPSPLKRYEELRASVGLMNVPIAFWGKVVDQDGTPLAGV